MSSLRAKAINSGFWSFFETFANKGLQFVVSIILARLLMPADFGIVGVLAIFIGIAGVLVDSGFKTSIIRTKNLTDADCSTIFWVNMGVGITVGSIIFLSANGIANLFDKPELVSVTRVFALIPVLNGLGLVQAAVLFKNLEFKRNAKIAVFSNIIAGGVAIFLAYQGFSYWALVWKSVLVALLYNLFLWLSSKWRPRMFFSVEIFKKHFRFSSRLLLTGIIDSFFDNIYSFIFGKYFSFSDLGFFTKGKSFVDLLTKNISWAIDKVSTPLLVASNMDLQALISGYKKILSTTTLLIFSSTIILIVVAEPMVIVLLGEKWLPAVPFIHILAFAGLAYPITNTNSSLFAVLGHSKIILRIAIINRPVQLAILLITIFFTPQVVAIGILLHRVFVFSLSVYWLQRLLKQPLGSLLYSCFPSIAISLVMGVVIYTTGRFSNEIVTTGVMFVGQVLLGITLTFLLIRAFNLREFEYIKMFFKR